MNRSVRMASVLAVVGASLHGQQASLPPVRQLGPRLAVGSDTLAFVSGIRQLSDGRVLINEMGRGRLLLYDATLSHALVVAGSTPGTKSEYGSASGGIIRYIGDTTLFVDGASRSLLVIDPAGRIVRMMSPPNPQDVASLTLPIGGAAFDGRGALVYRSTGFTLMLDERFLVGVGGEPAEGRASADTISTRDSSYIVRANISSRRIDTVGFITLPKGGVRAWAGTGPNGFPTYVTLVNPVLYYDDWAVLSDGSIAIVRGQDYHIDWVNADGTPGQRTTIAHEWHRLSDSEKTAIADSLRHVLDSTNTVRVRADSIAIAAGTWSPRQAPPVNRAVDPSDLPDYRAPFIGSGSNAFVLGPVVADADDNIWIRQGPAHSSLVGASPIYDVVNRQGRLVDRVQIPPSLTLAGFGPGVAYLISREGSGMVVVKYRIR